MTVILAVKKEIPVNFPGRGGSKAQFEQVLLKP